MAPAKAPWSAKPIVIPGEIRGVAIKRSDKAADHGRDDDGQAPPDMVANEAPKPHGKEDDGVVQDVGQGHVAVSFKSFCSQEANMAIME
jgi:hypothetical protein